MEHQLWLAPWPVKKSPFIYHIIIVFIYVWRTDASSLRVGRKKDKYEGGDIPSRAHLSSADNLDNTLLCILFADGDHECYDLNSDDSDGDDNANPFLVMIRFTVDFSANLKSNIHFEFRTKKVRKNISMREAK